MIAKLEMKYKIAPPAVKPAAGASGAAPLFAMTGVVAETAVVVTEENKKTTGAAAAASENDENNGGAGAAGTNENGGGSGRPRSQGVLSENDAAPAASVAGLGGGFPSLKVSDGGGAASKTAAEPKEEKDDAEGDGDDDDAADAAAPLPIATAVDDAPLLVATAITSASKEAAGPHPDDVRNAAYASGKKSSFMDSVRNGAAGAAPLPPPPPPPPALPRQLGPGPVQKDLVNSAVVEVQEWSRELIKWARELDDDARALAAAEANIDAQNAEITALDRRFAKEAVEARLLGAEGREWVLAFLRVCLLSADVSISLAAHTLLSTLSLLLLPSLPPPSPSHTHTLPPSDTSSIARETSADCSALNANSTLPSLATAPRAEQSNDHRQLRSTLLVLGERAHSLPRCRGTNASDC